MSEHRTINLNTFPLKQNKQHRKNYLNFHLRSDGLKIVGKEDAVQECKACHKILPSTAFTTHTPRADGAWYLKKICRECHTVLWKEQRDVRKNAPPKPNHCECCHKNRKLELDHLHGTTTLRGWLCRNCNTGIGALGDTLDGVRQAAIYLEKDKSKIIKKLNDLE